MLKIIVPGRELYNELLEEFVTTREQTLQLEHSLVSLSKWESKWKKPFLSNRERTNEELMDYIRCMTITQNVDPNVYFNLTAENVKDVLEYMDDTMTATTISDRGSDKNREVITAEILYYQMIALGIPFECQKWHLNRLLTLINVCAIKSGKPKKMSQKEILERNAALNAERRRKLKSRG